MEHRGVRTGCRRLALPLACICALAASACSKETDSASNPVLPMPGQAGTSAVPLAGASAAAGMAGVGTQVGAAGMSGGAGAAGTAGAAPVAGGAGTMAGVAGGAVLAGMGGGDVPAAGAGGGEPVPHEDLGEGDGQDVITIGDSWMNLILTGIEQSLTTASGRTYRHFAVPGTLVLNEQIPGQYESAKSADPDIKTVVMTGGGNDILNSSCVDAECEPIVDEVAARLTGLQQEMAADGVEDVVIIGYTYPADMGKHASLDYSIMLSQTSCLKTGMPRCHFIDSTMLDITLQDGIHPNAAGYDLIGQTVWALMQAEGMRR